MKIISSNKRATYDYQISNKLDAGIVLTGSEVKSLRNNSSSIKES
jgi:SsrA-binding protein